MATLISKHNKPRELYTSNVFKRILVDYSNYCQDLKAKLAVGQLHLRKLDADQTRRSRVARSNFTHRVAARTRLLGGVADASAVWLLRLLVT